MHSINNTSTASRRVSAAQQTAAGTMRELSDTELLLVSGAWSGYAFGFPGVASGRPGGMFPGGVPVYAYAFITGPLHDRRPQTEPSSGADLDAWKNAP